MRGSGRGSRRLLACSGRRRRRGGRLCSCLLGVLLPLCGTSWIRLRVLLLGVPARSALRVLLPVHVLSVLGRS